MKRFIKAGSTDQTLDIFVMDSSSAVGAGLTGLVFNSASLVCYYRRGATGSATQLTLATLATIGTAHADGGFKEVDATNMPGMYRLDLSDAIVAAGVPFVSIMLKGATNMAPVTIEIQLEQVPCDVTHWLGTAAATPTVAGVPEVDVTHLVGGNNTAALLATWLTAGVFGTADSGSTTTLTDTALNASSNSAYVGFLLVIYGGTNVGMCRRVAGFNAATDTITLDRALPSAIDATSTYGLIPWNDDVGAAGAGLTAIPWNAAWDAQVESEVDDALIAKGLDHLVFASVAGADVADNSIIAKMVSKSATADWDSFVNTTDALEAIRDKETDIETDTAEIGAAGAGLTALASQSSVNAIDGRIPAALVSGRMSSDAVAISGSTAVADSIEANISNLDAAVSTRATPAQVNAEVVDCLNVDTYPEIGQETPAATQTIRKMLAFPYKAWRNRKTQTATTFSLYADDATTVDQKSAVSDNGTTFDAGEMETGP